MHFYLMKKLRRNLRYISLQTDKSRYCDTILVLNSTSDELVLVPTADINSICVFMTVKEIDYLCKIPNLLYY